MHDETDYDRQYGLESFSTSELTREAGYIMDICRRHGLPAGAPVLEIGCGTGRISIGLALQPGMGHLLITDPSPAFCGIVQRKLSGLTVAAERVDFGILQAEDVNMLPAGSVSMILLRSVLHHIADVDGFLRACAAVLPTGGLFVCEEPYYDGYMMMGFLGQFIEDALTGSGYICTQEDQHRINHFISTMQFYSRRDIDKSQAEDKHLFRPDELMATGREFGLELTHYPNWRMTMSPEGNERARAGYFQRFFAEYVRYCMDWPEDFSKRVAEATRKYFRFFEPLETGGNTTPACFGTFVFTKR
ncbi:MAG: class I SAM-dependent methyltransferase [Bryobacterales bacterium]|nr:class I SAM-dependent methyltransferase [Bryobacterales bacterium]